jgi:hypothetical protein
MLIRHWHRFLNLGKHAFKTQVVNWDLIWNLSIIFCDFLPQYGSKEFEVEE